MAFVVFPLFFPVAMFVLSFSHMLLIVAAGQNRTVDRITSTIWLAYADRFYAETALFVYISKFSLR